MSKKGFTIIETIFALGIVASIMVVALPNFIISKKTTYITSMKEDIKSLSILLRNKQLLERDYYKIIGINTLKIEDTNKNGLGENTLLDSTSVPISQFNVAILKAEKCILNKSIATGFSIEITNPNVNNYKITFNTCTDSKIQIIDN